MAAQLQLPSWPATALLQKKAQPRQQRAPRPARGLGSARAGAGSSAAATASGRGALPLLQMFLQDGPATHARLQQQQRKQKRLWK